MHEVLALHHTNQLADAALASAALPGVFPPRKVRDKYYVDGSVREVVPFRGAIDFVGHRP